MNSLSPIAVLYARGSLEPHRREGGQFASRLVQYAVRPRTANTLHVVLRTSFETQEGGNASDGWGNQYDHNMRLGLLVCHTKDAHM